MSFFKDAALIIIKPTDQIEQVAVYGAPLDGNTNEFHNKLKWQVSKARFYETRRDWLIHLDMSNQIPVRKLSILHANQHKMFRKVSQVRAIISVFIDSHQKHLV